MQSKNIFIEKKDIYYRTTQEIFDDSINRIDKNKYLTKDMFIPKRYYWDYSREPNIEDVDLWEVIYERGGGVGVYGAFIPYCEYYMICLGWNIQDSAYKFETFYGKNAMRHVYSRCKELSIPININQYWVDNEERHHISKKSPKSIIVA